MTLRSIPRSRGLVGGVLAAFVLLVMPMGEFAMAQSAAPQGGSLAGFIYAKDMKTPVAGAVVKIRNVGDQKEFASLPSDANGMYTIWGIPEGRYLLGVTAAEGNFDFNYALYVKGSEIGKLSVALAPGAGAPQAGSDASTKKTGFFNTLAGRALIVAAVGVVVYVAFFTEKEASPIR
jgi:hypothetical protein